MASSPQPQRVIYSYDARDELRGIWKWDVKRHGLSQADKCQAFLTKGIDNLATAYGDGRDVDGFPELKVICLRPNRKGDGHYVVYEIHEAAGTVIVLHLYHTKMDLQGRIADEFQ